MNYQFDFSILTGNNLTYLAEGLWVSLQITVVALLSGLVWGTLLALMRLSRLRLISGFAALYINVFRSVPLVMVLLWFFLVMPQLLHSVLGLSPSTDMRMISALVAFSLFEAAYYAEIIRTGIRSVSKGQLAAAYALGMPHLQTMQLVVLPQAFRNMVPMLLTQAIVLFQDTALVYVSALSDFFGTAYSIGERGGRIVEVLLFAGGVYFVLCFCASLLVKFFRKRTAL